MKVTCTRRVGFCAGHRVLGHGGKCASWHGHEYSCLLTAEAASLDDLGMIVDFAVLKSKVGGWIDTNWDHGFLIYEADSEMLEVADRLSGHKTFVLPNNPTAENLAVYLLVEVCPVVLSGTGIRVTKVLLHETTNCSAEAYYDGEKDHEGVRLRLRQEVEA